MAKHVSSTSDFTTEVNKLAWQPVSLSRTGVLSLSDDLVADADLEVDASVLVGPSNCPTTTTTANPFPQCHTPLFREYAFPRWYGTGRVSGVSCKVVGDHPVRKGDTCARISIAKGTTFRLRAAVEDMHPSSPTYWPFIELERGCSAACDSGETRCAATQTCFPVGYAACAYCEGMTAQVCACRGTCGSKADASQCFFATSPDVEVVGKCNAGTCISSR